MKTFSIIVAGLRRDLPIVEVSKGTNIALFQMLGDIELCEAVAKEFVGMADKECDYIITPELKSVPLAHEMARIIDKPYIVVRKSRKSYMVSPIFETARPFTSSDQETIFWLDSNDAERIKGKDVWLVDDVITTGNTLRSVEALVTRIGGRVSKKFVVFKEGQNSDLPQGIIWLGELPIFSGEPGLPSSSLPLTEKNMDKFYHRALDLRSTWPIVYTAISKNMFCYRVLISKFVLEQQRVPINPFMNFDFGFFGLVPKDSLLTANNNAVRVADELWMFGPISDGAYAEILIAKELRHPIRYFTVSKSWAIMELGESEIIYED